MSGTNSQWVWDASRQQYCYWSTTDQCWVTQEGNNFNYGVSSGDCRIYANGDNVSLTDPGDDEGRPPRDRARLSHVSTDNGLSKEGKSADSLDEDEDRLAEELYRKLQRWTTYTFAAAPGSADIHLMVRSLYEGYGETITREAIHNICPRFAGVVACTVVDSISSMMQNEQQSPASSCRHASEGDVDCLHPVLKDFTTCLIIELSDGVHRNAVLPWIKHCYAEKDRNDAERIIRNASYITAERIRSNFMSEMASEVTHAHAAPWRQQLPATPLHEKEEFQQFLDQFLQSHLNCFYHTLEKWLESIARRLVEQSNDTESVLSELPNQMLPGLAYLSLFDFVFLCDDSYSMRTENRIEMLRETLRLIATVFLPISDRGISIRFINSRRDSDGTWDNLTQTEEIGKRMETVAYDGNTPLGTKLYDKILYPRLVQREKEGKAIKPFMVTIITDGEANNEAKGKSLSKIIPWCSKWLAEHNYPMTTVLFLVCRVGTSASAHGFLTQLERTLGDSMLIVADDIALKHKQCKAMGMESAYLEFLLKRFLDAFQKRKSMEDSMQQ